MTEHRFHRIGLAGGEARRALSLVQVTWPNVNASSWQRYVEFVGRRSKEGESGLLALSDSADYLNGVLLYEVEQDLQEGPVLTVHLFTAIDLANSVGIVRALLDAAKAKATDLGCAGVQIRLYSGQATLGFRLRSLGLSNRAGYLWKRIASD